ncbi:hypothetical protein RvY_05836 [Ramazzottius varieornatus]|uniref:histone acetyltransferase n=1 Tax=Ramazzottius varieornatus TaxID=947166 RepID=A0A1D1V321_RAMVA|nr:hypothetical protein RvY_05836 [Ramazzottius varieornatus]
MDSDSETVQCEQCGEDIDVSEVPRKRRGGFPPWVRCTFCSDVYHSSCAEIPPKCSRITNYNWECSSCRRCLICRKADATGMMFCDGCDRGCHGRCLDPPLLDVNLDDETPFLCKDCIDAKHTTRGFRRTKILGGQNKKLLVKSPVKPKRKPNPRQRHSRSLEAERDSSSAEDTDAHTLPFPHCCAATNCDGSGHLNGRSEKHFSLDTCPKYNRISAETSATYTALQAKLAETNPRKTYPKKLREAAEMLSGLADERMNIQDKPVKPVKPTDVFVAPEIKGISVFAKMMFEMGKVSNAIQNSQLDPTDRKKSFIEKIQIGKYLIEVNEMSATGRDEPLHKQVFFCDVCLEMLYDKTQFLRHVTGCSKICPPGSNIYTKNDIAIYEIDGKIHREFCQNLSILSRFFLSTKAVTYDVIYMMYYVLSQRGEDGLYRPVGYFSKDKDLEKNTLACILVLPQFEKRGFGKILIDLSYIIARTTHKPGTPERPLSRPGLLAFASYWKCVVSRALLKKWENTNQFSELMDAMISELGMTKEDIEDTFVRLDLIKTDPKTKKIMLLKAPAKSQLEENSKRLDEFARKGILIDMHGLSKTWMKALPNRKRID